MTYWERFFLERGFKAPKYGKLCFIKQSDRGMFTVKIGAFTKNAVIHYQPKKGEGVWIHYGLGKHDVQPDGEPKVVTPKIQVFQIFVDAICNPKNLLLCLDFGWANPLIEAYLKDEPTCCWISTTNLPSGNIKTTPSTTSWRKTQDT